MRFPNNAPKVGQAVYLLDRDSGQITEEKQRNDAGKELPILRVPFTLEHPVARETFRYLTS